MCLVMINKSSASEPVQIVAFHREYVGEPIFTMQGGRFVYCWCQYPSGRIDVGVYAYGSDMCYGYEWFRKQMGIA